MDDAQANEVEVRDNGLEIAIQDWHVVSSSHLFAKGGVYEAEALQAHLVTGRANYVVKLELGVGAVLLSELQRDAVASYAHLLHGRPKVASHATHEPAFGKPARSGPEMTLDRTSAKL